MSTVALSEYDARWPLQFEALAASIHRALGATALTLDHVGSTSVPGLAAKPVIDVALTVPSSAAEAGYGPQLEAIGYTLRVREPNWYEHRMYAHYEPSVNLHVFSQGCPEAERMRVFRDWLRTNATDRALYEQVKRSLAAKDWRCVQDYADAKSDVVREILQRAQA